MTLAWLGVLLSIAAGVGLGHFLTRYYSDKPLEPRDVAALLVFSCVSAFAGGMLVLIAVLTY